jgi:glutaredoxin
MHATRRLLSSLPRLPVHVTFFSRASCALCHNARNVLAAAWEKRPFEYVEIDVMTTQDTKWKDAYEFDVPVIHVVPTVGEGKALGEVGEGKEGRKLMHRFSTEEVVSVLEEVAKLRREE